MTNENPLAYLTEKYKQGDVVFLDQGLSTFQEATVIDQSLCRYFTTLKLKNGDEVQVLTARCTKSNINPLTLHVSKYCNCKEVETYSRNAFGELKCSRCGKKFTQERNDDIARRIASYYGW